METAEQNLHCLTSAMKAAQVGAAARPVLVLAASSTASSFWLTASTLASFWARVAASCCSSSTEAVAVVVEVVVVKVVVVVGYKMSFTSRRKFRKATPRPSLPAPPPPHRRVSTVRRLERMNLLPPQIQLVSSTSELWNQTKIKRYKKESIAYFYLHLPRGHGEHRTCQQLHRGYRASTTPQTL